MLRPPEDEATSCDEIMFSNPHHLLSKPMPTSFWGGRELSLLKPAQRVTNGLSPSISSPPTSSHRLAVPSIGDGPGTVRRVTHYCSGPYFPPAQGRLPISQGSHSCGGNDLRGIIKIQPPGAYPPEGSQGPRLCGATWWEHPEGAEGSVDSARLEFESWTCLKGHMT